MRPLALATLALAVAALAFAPSAQASKNIVGFFGKEGAGAGEFSIPRGVVVNEAGNGPGASPGDIYLLDVRSNRIGQFDSSGNFIRSFGRDIVVSGEHNTSANETQTVEVPSSVTGGTFQLRETTAVGRGFIAGGSNKLTNLVTENGTFVVGDVITANFGSLPPNTTITAVEPGTLTLSAAPSSQINNATFTGAATSEPIDFDAAANSGSGAANFQQTLEAMPGVGPGGVTVTGGPGASGTPFSVTFTGGVFGHNDIATMTIPSSTLEGGAASVADASQGGGPEICEAESSPIDVCQAAVQPSERGEAGSLESPNGIAIDQATGNLFVTDQGYSRISIYAPDGHFEGAFGWGVATGASELEFCSATCKAGIPGTAAGQFGEYSPYRDALDPSTGNLYVNDERNHRIEEFSFTHNGSGEVTGAAFVRAFGWGVDTGAEAFETCTAASTCNAGLSGNGVGELSSVEAVSVNSAGVVYTVEGYENYRVESFTPSGETYVPAVFDPADLSGTGFEDAPNNVAVGAGDHVFVIKSFPAGSTTCPNGKPSEREIRIVEVDASGVLQDTHLVCNGRLTFGFALGVNASTGDILLAGQRPVDESRPFGEAISTIYFLGEAQPPTAAIDSVTPNTSGATVTGRINPGGSLTSYPNPPTTTYQLEYKRTEDSAWIPWSVPINVGAGSADVPVTVHLGQLRGNSSYDVRLVANKAFGEGNSTTAPQTFQTLPVPPTIDAFSSSGPTATTIDLNAQIDPHGAPTTYRFEYGTTTSYGSEAPIPAGELEGAQGDLPVTVHLENLEKGAVYHFRVVATNATGTSVTGDQTFNFYPPSCPNASMRQQTGSDFLPDCRAYELVSPGETGNIILVATGVPAPYATSPTRFSFGGFLGGIEGTEPTNGVNADTYVATRTNTGWETKYVGIRGSEAESTSQSVGSLGLDEFLDFARGRQPASNAPYVWDAGGNFLGRWPADVASIPGGDSTVGAFQPSPDFSHLAFSSNNVDFDPGSAGLTVAPGSAYDYDTKTEVTTLISKLPGGGDIPQEPGYSNTGEYIQFPGGKEGGQPARMNQGVSTDGSHILMSTASSGEFEAPTRLYMSVNDAITYEVSEGHDVNYVGMTADGSDVYFTSQEQLTEDDHDSSTDLFVWREATNSITRLSTGAGAGDTDACVPTGGWTSQCGVEAILKQGLDRTDNAIAADTGEIYFYSPELLDGPENGLEGAQNLYVYREGRPRFVAISDQISRIQVSPNGDHVAFITRAQLTGFNNAGIAEMYSYEPSNGRILCVSCPITGEAPTANVEGSKRGLFMSNDGRTFFATTDALVPQDTNGLIDVYEYVDGRPQLISAGTGAADERSGNGAGESGGLVGVSADGVNVYFSTYDTLVAQDHNGQFLKFYDARTGGGFSAPPAPAPCEAADECHGPSTPAPPDPLITSGGDMGSGGNVHTKSSKRKHRRTKRHRRAHRHSRHSHRHIHRRARR